MIWMWYDMLMGKHSWIEKIAQNFTDPTKKPSCNSPLWKTWPNLPWACCPYSVFSASKRCLFRDSSTELGTAPNRSSPGWNGPMPRQKQRPHCGCHTSRPPSRHVRSAGWPAKHRPVQVAQIAVPRFGQFLRSQSRGLHHLHLHLLIQWYSMSLSHGVKFNFRSRPVIKLGALYCRLRTSTSAWTLTKNRLLTTESISVSTIHNLSVWLVTWSNVYCNICNYIRIYDMYCVSKLGM